MANRRDEVAMPTSLQPQHAKAAFGAVERDALDQASEHVATL